MTDDSTPQSDIPATPDLDAPVTRRDLLAFQMDILASLKTFEAHTSQVIVGLFRDLASAQDRVDDVAGDAEQGRAENRERISVIESRLALCASCPHLLGVMAQEPPTP